VVKDRKERQGRNPRTGETITISSQPQQHTGAIAQFFRAVQTLAIALARLAFVVPLIVIDLPKLPFQHEKYAQHND
jgi:hypothetical protein